MAKNDYKKNGNFIKNFKNSTYTNFYSQEDQTIEKVQDNMIKCKDGCIVKSKSEMLIDNFLYDHSIRHIYEKKILGKLCDWYLIDHDVYVEFVGLNNHQYMEKLEKKIKRYSQYGLRVIQIFDYNLRNLDSILEILERMRRKLK